MLVTLSAAYGAAGSRIGPAVAERLDVPFCDRAIALTMAHDLDVPVEEALAYEVPADRGLLARLLRGFAGADPGLTMALPGDVITPEDVHRASREAVLAQAAAGEGVILGRGGGAALRDDPRVLRVRLTGAPNRRTRQAAELGGVDEATADRARRHLDGVHSEYLKQFYGVDIDDVGLYHLIIDSTSLPHEVCVDLIELAARGRTDGR
ncbi:MAG: cytidylate kinase-like family protein [Solirubrobacteraceae bacterium]